MGKQTEILRCPIGPCPLVANAQKRAKIALIKQTRTADNVRCNVHLCVHTSIRYCICVYACHRNCAPLSLCLTAIVSPLQLCVTATVRHRNCASLRRSINSSISFLLERHPPPTINLHLIMYLFLVWRWYRMAWCEFWTSMRRLRLRWRRRRRLTTGMPIQVHRKLPPTLRKGASTHAHCTLACVVTYMRTCTLVSMAIWIVNSGNDLWLKPDLWWRLFIMNPNSRLWVIAYGTISMK